MKRVAIVVLAFCLVCPLVFAGDFEEKSLQLQILMTEVEAIRAAVQRDNAQIAFLQERIKRLNLEVQKRLEEAKEMRVIVERLKPKEEIEKK